MNYFLVFVGGGIGSICRYMINQVLHKYSFAFPWATFLANALSCILFGVIAALLLKNKIAPIQGIFLLTGFCGGFSTFSTFTNETFILFQNGQSFYAALNIIANVIVCSFCLYIALKITSFF